MNVRIKVSTTDVFRKWFDNLKDDKAFEIITKRLDRVRSGNLGDWKRVVGVKNIFELRIDVSKGYRIYFTKKGNTIVILLCGGIKDSQKKNIKEAERILNDLKF